MALTTRRRALTTLGAALAGAVALPAGTALASEGRHGPRPLWRSHAHNDYQHPRPLLDGQRPPLRQLSRPTSTWSAANSWSPTTPRISTRPAPWSPLYLDPLAARVRAGHGRVYRRPPAPCNS
ncbi:Glycerophosphoryl diester phosphodiesterase family protein OS=Streptomyces tendae OX=1932 GN=GUR47_29550 PE=4 SV=1 [Streptomyces tendae]